MVELRDLGLSENSWLMVVVMDGNCSDKLHFDIPYLERYVSMVTGRLFIEESNIFKLKMNSKGPFFCPCLWQNDSHTFLGRFTG